MKRKLIVFMILLTVLTSNVFCDEVPAFHPAYRQLHSLIKDSGIRDLNKYMEIKSGMLTAEMAEVLAQILINQSFIDLDEEEDEKKPLFYRLRNSLPELRELSDFLRKELEDYNISYQFLTDEYDKLDRWMLKEQRLTQAPPLPDPYKPEPTEDEVNREEQEFIQIKEEIKQALGKEKSFPEKPRYSPSKAFRLIDMHNADVLEKNIAIETDFAIYKTEEPDEDATQLGLNRLGAIYTPRDRYSLYLYTDYLEKEEEDGFYHGHHSIQLGGKLQLTKFDKHPFKFALGGDFTYFMIENLMEDYAQVYVAGAFTTPKWIGTQILANLTWVNRNKKNKFLPALGWETQIRDWPIYFLAETRRKYHENSWINNWGLRLSRKRAVIDLTYEDDHEFDRQKVGFNALWKF